MASGIAPPQHSVRRHKTIDADGGPGTGFDFVPLSTPLNFVHMPANANIGSVIVETRTTATSSSSPGFGSSGAVLSEAVAGR